MSKYICVCGVKFKKKSEGHLHELMYKDVEHLGGLNVHKVFKSHWQVRVLDFIYSVDVMYYLAFISGATINSIVLTHLTWDSYSKTIESLCMGIVLAQLLRETKR